MPLPTDASELFNEYLPAGLARHPDKARELNTIYQFNISGEGGGEWTCDLTADPPTCVPGNSGRGQCTVEVTNEDFKTILSDPNAGMQLYFQGRFRVSGDQMYSMKLQALWQIASAD